MMRDAKRKLISLFCFLFFNTKSILHVKLQYMVGGSNFVNITEVMNWQISS